MLLILAWFLNKRIKTTARLGLEKVPTLEKTRVKKLINSLLMVFIWWIFIWGYYLIGTPLGFPNLMVVIVGNLLSAWLVIKFVSILIPGEKFIVKLLSYLVWTIVVLNISGLYNPVTEMLDNIVFAGGNITLSLMDIIRGVLIFSLLFWLSGHLHSILKNQIENRTKLTPSIKLLFYKTIRVLLIVVVVLITLSSLGVELSTFAFLGGAIGVGVGFGLQKIVSNYVSGIIILLDGSIKPGDVIEIDDVFGRIRSQETLFVSMVTLSGKEYLIPNENFITQQVINWSHSNNRVRLDVEIGVAYGSDMREVEELVLEATKDINRVLERPKPVCLMKEFGDNTVNFELRFWINDPELGVYNVRSDVLFAIWDSFAEAGIEISFPQRDLHVKSLSAEVVEEIKN